MNTGISAVILNWKRPENVARIVSGWLADGFVTEAIVWNNNPAAPFRHGWAQIVNAEQDLGLYTRFAAACPANYECILIQDDDLAIPVNSLRVLYEAWRRSPDVLHGIFGRRPAPDGSYDPRNVGTGEAPIVLTRALLAHRRYASEFFKAATRFETIQRDGRPVGNGEDIIFSYTVMQLSGRMNYVHRLPVSELPAPDAIHQRDRTAHLAHRSRLLRACQDWLTSDRRAA